MRLTIIPGLLFIMVVGASVLGAAAAARGQTATGEPIKIGAVISVTGPAAGLGVPERNVLVMTEKVINARGGVNGRPIQVIIRDDATNPDTALSQANDLIFGQKVVAILGATITAPTVAIGGVTHKIKLPHLAFSGIGPAVERERKCVFHMPVSQELHARALLAYARSINAKRLGVLHDAGVGNIVLAELRLVLDAYGATIVAAEKFEFGATDITTQAAKVKVAQPEAIIVVTASATPFRDVRRLQMTQPIIAHMASSTYEYVNAMGKSADNIVFPEFLVAEDPLPHQRDFVELSRKELGTLPKNVDAFVWDSVHVLTQALAKAGPGADGEKICEAIRQTPYAGVFANYNFAADDMNGIQLSSFVYSKLVGGQYTRLPFRAAQ